MIEKNMQEFFPTYLLNQKIQDRGTANKHFFKDGLGYIFITLYNPDKPTQWKHDQGTGRGSFCLRVTKIK